MTTEPTKGGQLPRVRLRLPMRARSPNEEHRVSTNLELLFDLVFVVAVAQVSVQLAHHVEQNDFGQAVLGYLLVFFAIWWAWVNFAWFASAYDTDDVPYRLLTLLQMTGASILAAGVPAAFEERVFAVVTVGYAVMRLALVGQWIRAARSDPAGARTAWRFAYGVAGVQVLWLLRLLLPPGAGLAAFFALVVLELAVPVWAERAGSTAWHPHHIVERYGLFTIIVLGESVLAATVAVQSGITEDGVTVSLAAVGLTGLALLFILWWLYFLVPVHLETGSSRRSFVFGYAHYFVYAALAAVGAGLEVAVAASVHGAGSEEGVRASALTVAFAVAIPVSVFLASWWVVGDAPLPSAAVAATIVATLGLAFLPLTGAPAPWCLAALVVPVLALLVGGILRIGGVPTAQT
jgi:low temperature requirement protein LtrA